MVARHKKRQSTLVTMGDKPDLKLLEEAGETSYTESINISPVPALRMKKVNLEAIYSQAEKDREGEKLKQLCDMHED